VLSRNWPQAVAREADVLSDSRLASKSAKLKRRERASGLVDHNARVIEDFLKLGCGLASFHPGPGQIRCSAHVYRVQADRWAEAGCVPQVVRCRDL